MSMPAPAPDYSIEVELAVHGRVATLDGDKSRASCIGASGSASREAAP